MRRYQAVLLDVDGTLVDSNDAHAHAWVEAFAERDLEVAWSQVRRMIGMGGDRIVETLTGLPRDSKENEQIGARRSELFRERWLHTVTPFPRTRDFMLLLRSEGYHYAIASAARGEELSALLEIADIADLCEIATTSSDVEESKPEPDIIEAALARLPVARHRTVMIGDTPYDLQSARGANVDMIGVTTGGWTRDALGTCVGIFAGVADLWARWSESPLGPSGSRECR